MFSRFMVMLKLNDKLVIFEWTCQYVKIVRPILPKGKKCRVRMLPYGPTFISGTVLNVITRTLIYLGSSRLCDRGDID